MEPRESGHVEEITVPVEDGTLVAWRSGSGARALLLHGGPGLSDYTEGLADELDGLYECIRYQQRGVEPSEAPGPYSIDQFVRDAVAVLDAAHWDTATIIGHSWGGGLALHLVGAHADRTDALISVDGMGALGPDGGWDLLDKNMEERLPQDISKRVAEIDERLYAGEGTPEESLEMMTLSWPYYFADPANAPPMPPVRMSDEVYAHIHEDWMALMKEGRPEKGVRSYPKRALWIHGDSDPVAIEPAQAAAEVMSNATFITIENCASPGRLRVLPGPAAPTAERMGPDGLASHRRVGRAP
jgi:proline iminopeptidase